MPPDPEPKLAAYRGAGAARALVLGGSGFIGHHVVLALARAGVRELGWTTRDPALTKGTASAPVRAATTLPGRGHVIDLRDDAELRSLIADFRPSVTFNLAGYGVDSLEREEEEAQLLNDRLVGVVANALAHHRDEKWRGLELVHAGSALEYGALSGDLVETTEPNPTTLYGRTKLAGTRRLAELAASLPLRAATARLFMVYGPGEHSGRLLPSLIDAARRREPLPLTAGTQKRDFTWVEDVAEALLRLALAPGVRSGEAVNVATGKLVPVREFAECAARTLDMPVELLRFGELPIRAREMEHAPVNVRRLQALLGWLPSTTIEEGLRRSAAGR